jgi:hypothetical protein
LRREAKRGNQSIDLQPRGQVRFDVLDPYVFALKIAPGTGVLDLCGPPW